MNNKEFVKEFTEPTGNHQNGKVTIRPQNHDFFLNLEKTAEELLDQLIDIAKRDFPELDVHQIKIVHFGKARTWGIQFEAKTAPEDYEKLPKNEKWINPVPLWRSSQPREF